MDKDKQYVDFIEFKNKYGFKIVHGTCVDLNPSDYENSDIRECIPVEYTLRKNGLWVRKDRGMRSEEDNNHWDCKEYTDFYNIKTNKVSLEEVLSLYNL